MKNKRFTEDSDLGVEVLLKLQLLFEGLDAILSVHPPQHLILQLLPGIAQTGVQLRKHNGKPILVDSNEQTFT